MRSSALSVSFLFFLLPIVSFAADKVVVVPLLGGAANISSTMVVRANGTTVGRFAGLAQAYDHTGYYTMTTTGYFMRLSISTGEISAPTDIWFSGTDCTGNKYVTAYFGAPGEVVGFRQAGSYYLYYTEKGGAPPQVLTANSRIDIPSTNCVNMPADLLMLPLINNDPVVTGVSSGQFDLPLTVELGTP